MFVCRMAEIKALLALIGLPWTRSTLICTTVALGEASDRDMWRDHAEESDDCT